MLKELNDSFKQKQKVEPLKKVAIDAVAAGTCGLIGAIVTGMITLWASTFVADTEQKEPESDEHKFGGVVVEKD